MPLSKHSTKFNDLRQFPISLVCKTFLTLQIQIKIVEDDMTFYNIIFFFLRKVGK